MQHDPIARTVFTKAFRRSHTAETSLLGQAVRELLLCRLASSLAASFCHHEDIDPEKLEILRQPLRDAPQQVIHILNKINDAINENQSSDFIDLCNSSACHGIGYARWIVFQIIEQDYMSTQPDTPSHTAMLRAVRIGLKEVISENSLNILKTRRVAEGARTFGKSLNSIRSAGTTPDIDAVMNDITLVRAAQIVSGGDSEIYRALQIHDLVKSHSVGSA